MGIKRKTINEASESFTKEPSHLDKKTIDILDNMFNDEILEETFFYNDDKLLEQYKLNVEMINDIGRRRDQMSKFYITLISSILSIGGIILSITTIKNYFLLLPIFVVCFLLAYFWKNHIEEFGKLGYVKFLIICNMEQYLPLRSYRTENKLLNQTGYIGIMKWELKLTKSIKYGTLIGIIIILAIYICQHYLIL